MQSEKSVYRGKRQFMKDRRLIYEDMKGIVTGLKTVGGMEQGEVGRVIS